MATKRSLEKWIHILSIPVMIILTRLLCQMQANSSGAEFSRTNIHAQKEKENFFIMSSTKREIRKFYVVVVQWQQRNVQKAYCTCKVVVLPIQPIAILTFPIVVAILIA